MLCCSRTLEQETKVLEPNESIVIKQNQVKLIAQMLCVVLINHGVCDLCGVIDL